MKADDIYALSEITKDKSMSKSLKEVAKLIKNKQPSFDRMIELFESLSEEMTALAFTNSDDLSGVNKRTCMYIHLMIGKLLENLPQETQKSILNAVESDFSNKSVSPSYIG